MSKESIIISIGPSCLEVSLYDTAAAGSLVRALPQKIRMNRWGDEYYGELSVHIRHGGDAERDVFEVGEVALWPAGNALCIFFGPTPASRSGEPRMASKGVPFGKIVGDVSVLKELPGTLDAVSITKAGSYENT
jgi:hypothetical protein